MFIVEDYEIIKNFSYIRMSCIDCPAVSINAAMHESSQTWADSRARLIISTENYLREKCTCQD